MIEPHITVPSQGGVIRVQLGGGRGWDILVTLQRFGPAALSASVLDPCSVDEQAGFRQPEPSLEPDLALNPTGAVFTGDFETPIRATLDGGSDWGVLVRVREDSTMVLQARALEPVLFDDEVFCAAPSGHTSRLVLPTGIEHGPFKHALSPALEELRSDLHDLAEHVVSLRDAARLSHDQLQAAIASNLRRLESPDCEEDDGGRPDPPFGGWSTPLAVKRRL